MESLICGGLSSTLGSIGAESRGLNTDIAVTKVSFTTDEKVRRTALFQYFTTVCLFSAGPSCASPPGGGGAKLL
jgi:hypothetical protein